MTRWPEPVRYLGSWPYCTMSATRRSLMPPRPSRPDFPSGTAWWTLCQPILSAMGHRVRALVLSALSLLPCQPILSAMGHRVHQGVGIRQLRDLVSTDLERDGPSRVRCRADREGVYRVSTDLERDGPSRTDAEAARFSFQKCQPILSAMGHRVRGAGDGLRAARRVSTDLERDGPSRVFAVVIAQPGSGVSTDLERDGPSRAPVVPPLKRK